MESRRKGSSVVLFAALVFAIHLSAASEGWAQWGRWGLGISGTLGTGFSYDTETSGDMTTWSTNRSDSYSLEVNGRILDPRLATFSIAGALSTNDVRSNQSGSQDSRLLSFIGNLSLLSGKPYPLDLRISQSHQSGGTESDVLSFGGSWRVLYGNLPSIFLSFDRVNVETKGDIRNESTFTTGNLRLVKRVFDSDLDAELGIQNVTDKAVETSTTRYFSRLTGTNQWNPATTVRILADYFSQDDSRSVGSSFSLINRPDPTLSRSLGVGFRNTQNEGQTETALDANGAIFKSYQLYPTLTVSPFSSALVSRRFASGDLGDATFVSGSLGSSMVSTYFRQVLATADYGLGVSYSSQEEEGSKLGTTQQFHLGLQSMTLQPYSARGDYLFTLERTLTERNRHQASVRVEGPVMPALHFRSFAEFFNDNARFAQTENRQTIFTLGGSLSYTGIRRLYIDLGGSALRSENQDTSSWNSRLTANLSYTPLTRLSLQLSGQRETDTLVHTTRYEGIARILYLFGQSTVNFEYRFGARLAAGESGYGHSIQIRLNRPFRFAF
jgi:hypothetical protein